MMINLTILLFVILFSLVVLSRSSIRSIWVINLLFCIFISFIAYNIVPLESLDLHRYYTQIEIAEKNGIDYIFNNADFESLPVAAIYISIFVLIGNKFLLPAVTCFIYYFLPTSFLVKISKKNKLTSLGLVLSMIVFYSISNYLGVVSGIRNPMAISIFCYFLYKDLIQKEGIRKFIIPYILLCFFHSSIIILLTLRLLLMLNKKNDNFICLLLLLWSIVKTTLISILSNSIKNSYILMLAHKLTDYDQNEANAVANVTLYTFIYLLFYISSIFIYSIYSRKTYNKINEPIKIDRYYKFLLFFCVGSIFEYHIFVRFSRCVLILNMFFITKIMSDRQCDKKAKTLITILLVIESLAFLLFYTTGQYTFIKLQ